MPIKNSNITTVLASILLLIASNSLTAATPVKKTTIKKPSTKKNIVVNRVAKISNILGLPKAPVRLGSKIKLTLKGQNLNGITRVQLLNKNRSAGKVILAKASKRTNSQRAMNIVIDKRAMKGKLTFKFYSKNALVKNPKISEMQLETKKPTQSTRPPAQNLFKSITIATDPLKFTGQRPELFKSITINTDPLKFTGQRPELFMSITINTDPLKFTGQRPELFKSITINTDALKFTGKKH